MYGFKDKILRINLTEHKISIESPGEEFFKRYLGGKNIVGYYLNKELPGNIDPLGPDNKLIIATSVLTGSKVAGTSRYTIAAKSPMTGCFCDAEAGGFFGPELKFAGYDGVIIEGKADKPCYIMIKDRDVQIKDATHIWGRNTCDVESQIRIDNDDTDIRVLQTGPAGEKLVRFAALTNQHKNWNGRGGLGAVFGSKNLRAIAVRGTGKLNIKYEDEFMEFVKNFASNFTGYRDFQFFDKSGRSRYKTLEALGSNCGIKDTSAIDKSNELCDKYGLDIISTGVTITFAMECFTKGLITLEDTNGIVLKSGNVDAYLKIIEQIGERKGFGDVLAEGSYRAAIKIGNGAEKLAMVSKKLEFLDYELMKKMNPGLGCAISSNGTDHIAIEYEHIFIAEPIEDGEYIGEARKYPLYKFGIRKPIDDFLSNNDKLRFFVILEKIWGIYNALDIINFMGEPAKIVLSIEQILKNVNLVTGWDLSLFELMQIGEKGCIMGRLFNAKAGITNEDETLPDKMFEPLDNDGFEGNYDYIDREVFEKAKQTYYEMMGMDKKGKPLYGKLVNLDLVELWEE